MDYRITDTERLLEDTAKEITNDFGQMYFRKKRTAKEEATEFLEELAEAGFFGITFSEQYGGEGLGMMELVRAIETIGKEGGWSQTTNLVINAVAGSMIKNHGTEDQKDSFLPKMTKREIKWAVGITEPDTGQNTYRTSTTADRLSGDKFVINGQKAWISGIHKADNFIILTRTKPYDDVDKRSNGLTLFTVDPNRSDIEFDKIDLDIYFPEETYIVNIDNLEVEASQVLGQVDKGASVLWDGMNPERITTSAEHIGRGKWALERAVNRAKDREVWGEPIGAHQGVQHPLAQAHADIAAAEVMLKKAAFSFDNNWDNHMDLGNIAHLVSSQSAYDAIDNAVGTFGGSSATENNGIAALHSLIRHQKIAPIPENMKLNYIANEVLDLPRSYGY